MAKKKGETKKLDPIAVEVRTTRGRRHAQALRAEGKLPGILYGLKKDPVAISLPFSPVVSALHSGAHLLEIVLDGKAEKVLVQDVQYDFLDTTVDHIDLMRIDPNQKVRVRVPLDFRGTPKGTKEGGILETPITEIEIEVLATAIPDDIRVNVEDMELHAILHAREVTLPAGAKLVDNPERIVAQVRTVKEELPVAEGAAAGPAEPEVIGKKKEEEGAEGAEGAAPTDAKGGGKASGGPAKK